MKSPLVERSPHVTNKNGYSELTVLSSAAGYYVGTMYNEYDESGVLRWQEPGSRDSDYFDTHEQAEKYLRLLESTNETAPSMVQFMTRQNP